MESMTPQPANQFAAVVRATRSGRARQEAATANEMAAIVRALDGEPLRHVAAQLSDGDLTCFRLVCNAFRAHSAKPAKRPRSAFARSAALVKFAWEQLPKFRGAAVFCELEKWNLPALAAGWGSVDALAWLHAAGCGWSAADAAASKFHSPRAVKVPARAAKHGQLDEG